MRLIQPVLRHPIAVLALFATAFIFWLWRDSLPATQPVAEENRFAEPFVPILLATPHHKKMRTIPLDTADAIAKLKPGMTRAEMENLIGVPAPNDTYPAIVTDGKVTYQTAYGIGFGSTEEPTLHPTEDDPAPKGTPFVTLEFDATKPGHPLLAVHSLDLLR